MKNSEARLYRSIFNSEKTNCQNKPIMLYLKFVQWEKSCAYIAKQTAIDKWELIDNDAYNAKLIVNNPREEKSSTLCSC